MVAKRDSIVKVAMPLTDMIMAGQGASTKALELAVKLRRMVERSGVYEKRYDNNEERVLNRHLNLYRNKLATAKTTGERARWTGKIAEQKQKIREYEAARDGLIHSDTAGNLDLDLDGL